VCVLPSSLNQTDQEKKREDQSHFYAAAAVAALPSLPRRSCVRIDPGYAQAAQDDTIATPTATS